MVKTKKCTECKKKLPATAEYFHREGKRKDGLRSNCKECKKKARHRWYLRTIEERRKYTRQYNRRRKFGLTDSQYNLMAMEQRGLCAICGLPEVVKQGDRLTKLGVDHNHSTNKIRGLLCNKCNVAMGMLNIDNQGIELLCSAINYVRNTDG